MICVLKNRNFLAVAALAINLVASLPTVAQQRPGDLEQPLPTVPPAQIAFRSLHELDTRIAPPAGSFPVDFSGRLFQPAERAPEAIPVPKTFWWEAPEIWWRPLYFDNVPLERYGQTPMPRLQPALSGAEFFLMLPILPYKMTVEPPWSRKTNLGYYRPGSPMPCVGRRLPVQADAMLVEAASWVTLVFLLP